MWRALSREHMVVPEPGIANGVLGSGLPNRLRLTKAFQQCIKQMNTEWMQMTEDLGSENTYFAQLSIALQDLQAGQQEPHKAEANPAAIQNNQNLSTEIYDGV